MESIPHSSKKLLETDVSKETIEEVVHLKDHEEARLLFGFQDTHLKLLRNRCKVRLTARNKLIKISGLSENVYFAKTVLNQLCTKIRERGSLDFKEVSELLSESSAEEFSRDQALSPIPRILPMTSGQRHYVECMRQSELVFAIGPAGSGKTLLAVDSAIYALQQGMVRKIVLTRPAVEAGERLGFLPGDLKEKVDPYLRPLYDSLYTVLGPEKLQKYTERNIIEIAPLAYMRGRTLSHSFIILDEAQNTTSKQMQMFLTRFGQHSRCVVTGDITQTDVPSGTISGLKDVERILQGVAGIEFAYLTKKDIVRHPLVERIVDAYDRALESRSVSRVESKSDLSSPKP